MNIMNNFYKVTFDTKKGTETKWRIDVEAATAKEARTKAETLWNETRTAHMFHIDVKRIKDTEEFLFHYFHKLEA
jgi:hypothetical protein